jgi:hypothetical protein
MKKSTKKSSPVSLVSRALQDGVRMGMSLAAKGVTEDQASEFLAEFDEGAREQANSHSEQTREIEKASATDGDDRSAGAHRSNINFFGNVTIRIVIKARGKR